MAQGQSSEFTVDEFGTQQYIVPSAFWVPYDGNVDDYTPNYEFPYYPSPSVTNPSWLEEIAIAA